MAKPEAPKWLREAFRDGIDEREMVYRDGIERVRKKARPYAGANPWCWLAQFDPKQLPCAGQPGHFIERFHFLRRQHVEEAIHLYLDRARMRCPVCEGEDWRCIDCEGCFGARQVFMPGFWRDEIVQLAAWDPRNGGLGCERHHRRLDHQAVSPREPVIEVPALALPDHVREFVDYWNLYRQAEGAFEGYR